MKFATLALLGTASATTITIDDSTVGEIARTWQKNAEELDRKLQGLYDDEMRELEPYG